MVGLYGGMLDSHSEEKVKSDEFIWKAICGILRERSKGESHMYGLSPCTRPRSLLCKRRKADINHLCSMESGKRYLYLINVFSG
jgi:hypothetical protein